ncbi:MAG: PEGA domain-containing protein [Myxococcota bacterium]
MALVRTTIGRVLPLLLVTVALAPNAAEAQRPIPVHIESTPPGAAVYVDSTQGAPIGTTPMRNVRIPRGNHTLIFRLASHEDATLPVNIRRRRETFRATLNPLGTISIMAGNDSANGAAVRIDGAPQGNVPFRTEVQPGRHLVQVGREGYVTFSQWVELAGGQVLSLPVMLEREAPETGSLLVAGDVSGAGIYIDGTPRGSTPTVIDGLTAGPHQVEVRPNDPDMQTHRETVQIIAGQRATINYQLRPTQAAGGSLRVIANVPTATIRFDGEDIGPPPASRQNIAPGEHIIEALAEGYAPVQQPVTIEAGQQRVVSLTLQEVQGAPGRIVVNANVDGATVLVDGEDRGAPPVVVPDATQGTHAIIVRAPGYQEHRQTCAVAPGQDCVVDAELEPVGTPVRVEANIDGAEFFVDGNLMGPVPWEGTMPTGSHLIEVRANGYRTYRAQVSLQPQSDVRVFNVGMVGEGELTPDERLEARQLRRERHRNAVARSGATLPNDLAVLDVSLGWPYLAELRMGIGVLDFLEVGVGLRTTFYRLTEFEGRVKAGWRPVRQVSFGGQVRIGGGLGPSFDAPRMDPNRTGGAEEDLSYNTNTFFFSLEALLSLHFLNAGNFTLWMAMDVHRDSWAWNGSNDDCRWEACVRGPGGDIINDTEVDFADALPTSQTVVRARLGGSLEFIINDRLNVWGSFEGILAGGNRRILGDLWGFENSDIQLYTRLGITYKFGYADRGQDAARVREEAEEEAEEDVAVEAAEPEGADAMAPPPAN